MVALVAQARANREIAEHLVISERTAGDLIAALDTWPTPPVGRAYDPQDAIWVLSMLADFGLRREDPRIAAIAERLFASQAAGSCTVASTTGDPRSQQVVAELEAKRRADGCRWAEGVNQPYAACDFGQKKGPSPSITLLALRSSAACPAAGHRRRD